MLAAINAAGSSCSTNGATFFLSSIYSAAHTSFEIATVSLTEIRMWTTTFRPFAIRVEVVTIRWLVLTTLLVILLIYLWLA